MGNDFQGYIKSNNYEGKKIIFQRDNIAVLLTATLMCIALMSIKGHSYLLKFIFLGGETNYLKHFTRS